MDWGARHVWSIRSAPVSGGSDPSGSSPVTTSRSSGVGGIVATAAMLLASGAGGASRTQQATVEGVAAVGSVLERTLDAFKTAEELRKAAAGEGFQAHSVAIAARCKLFVRHRMLMLLREGCVFATFSKNPHERFAAVWLVGVDTLMVQLLPRYPLVGPPIAQSVDAAGADATAGSVDGSDYGWDGAGSRTSGVVTRVQLTRASSGTWKDAMSPRYASSALLGEDTTPGTSPNASAPSPAEESAGSASAPMTTLDEPVSLPITASAAMLVVDQFEKWGRKGAMASRSSFPYPFGLVTCGMRGNRLLCLCGTAVASLGAAPQGRRYDYVPPQDPHLGMRKLSEMWLLALRRMFRLDALDAPSEEATMLTKVAMMNHKCIQGDKAVGDAQPLPPPPPLC